VIADVVSHRIVGQGTDGYRMALEHLAEATR
jgi:3-dehydroquinate dehydratase